MALLQFLDLTTHGGEISGRHYKALQKVLHRGSLYIRQPSFEGGERPAESRPCYEVGTCVLPAFDSQLS
ncbi:hypothetical protein AAFF_G00087080 [Aldrovandia affinis]|uniref:Uncharacterized protein n=1 Tax=Aldrovandia affinis TaxID=143900 RepID=A0AAD7RWJ1_9TELE|nr:hypothetical protein AAFF_G00087080 [Aldrovandia affinis]